MLNIKTIVFSFSICALALFCNLCFGVCHLTYAQDASKEEEAFFVARKAFQDGFYDVSLKLLENFKQNYPASSKIAQAQLLTGECYFHQNKFLDALAKFNSLLNQPQTKALQDALFYWIAEVHFRGNDFTRAAAYYQKIIDEFSDSEYRPIAYYSLGWCQFQERLFKEALANFEIVENKFPQENFSQDASFKIIECLYNLKDYPGIKERIRPYLKKYARSSKEFLYLYFYLAESDYYLNNFEEAIDGYETVLKSNPDTKIEALSYLGIGWAYFKLKQYRQAEEAFAQVRKDKLPADSHDSLLLAKAILMTETKRFDEAKKIYEELNLTTAQPIVAIQALLGEAEIFYNLGEYKQAISTYQIALQNLSGSIAQEIADKLHYGLAWAFLKEGEFKQAIEEFQKIAKQSEDKIVKISALCQIGDAYQDSGDYAQAIQTYDGMIKDYPDSFYSDYVQYQLGMVLLKTSKYDAAIMAFNNLKAGFPNSKLLADATYAMGLAYFQKEDYGAAKEVLEKFRADFEDNNLKSQAIYLLGTSLYNLGKFNEAIEAFKDVIRASSQDSDFIQKAEYEIADCFYQLGNEKEAVARFKVLRSKYPDSRLAPEVMWWLGEYYYRHNNLDLAPRYFSSLIQDFPKNNLVPDAYYALGSIYEEQAEDEKAINNFNKVIELGKSDLTGQATAAIAGLYAKQNQFDSAIKKYKQVISEYPNLVNLIYPRLAEVYFKAGNYNEAIELYQKSLDVVPVRQMSEVQFKIAEIREAQGNSEEAVEDYLKVTYLYSQDNNLAVKALLRVAAIYEGKENPKEAVNIYKRIVSMNVDEAKYAQERINWLITHKAGHPAVGGAD